MVKFRINSCCPDLHNVLSVAERRRGRLQCWVTFISLGVSCHTRPLGGTVPGGTNLPTWSRPGHTGLTARFFQLYACATPQCLCMNVRHKFMLTGSPRSWLPVTNLSLPLVNFLGHQKPYLCYATNLPGRMVIGVTVARPERRSPSLVFLSFLYLCVCRPQGG